MHRLLLLAGLSAIILTGCGSDSDSGPAASPSVAENGVASDSATAGELGHTSWQLVRIRTPDDTILEPADPSVYTLAFEPDGTAQLSIDCNRGNGTWSSDGPGEVEFGPIASTRAMCPPESLHDPYLAHFDTVATYAIDDEHLFLRSGLTGAFMEFEHANEAPLAATVLGQEIRTDDAGEMQAAILTALFEHYEAENGISATDAEIDAFIARLALTKQQDISSRKAKLAEMDDRLKAADLDTAERDSLQAERTQLAEFIRDLETSGDELSEEEATQVAEMRRSFSRQMITQWKLNRALHKQYGGRIISQQFGPEPLDAYREFLEEQQSKAAFEIHRDEMAQEFWRYFSDDSIHSFLDPASKEASDAFSQPPWAE